METINSLTGTILQSGALCIASRSIGNDGDFAVLAFRTHPLHPYVVWNADSSGNCWRGDYCATINEAVELYDQRF